VAEDTFLETERLVLRDKRPADAGFVAELSADPRVMRWIGDGSTYSREEAETRFARVLAIESGPANERWHAFKILIRKEDGVPIGQAGLLRCEIDGAPEVEIGWWLAPSAWGRGYATEAALALCDFAFRELRLDRLSVVLHAENAKSVAVALRLGAVHAGTAVYRERTVTRYLLKSPRARLQA
jgi:RimJ/RimL family protein N-acetyltransferase